MSREPEHERNYPALAALAAMIPFAAAGKHGLVGWDDPAMAGLRNPLLEKLDAAHLAAMWSSGHMTAWQPLGWLGYAWLRFAFGVSGPAIHASMLLLHAACAVLAYGLLRKLMPKVPAWAALAAVCLWAAHPARTEAVVWAAQLADLLCALFALLCLRAYAADEDRAAGALALLAAACRWKAVVILPLALGVDALRGKGLKRTALLSLLPGVLVAAAANGWAKHAGGYGGAFRPHEACAGLLLHLSRLLVPRHLAPGLMLDGADNPLKLSLASALIGVGLAFGAAAASPLALGGLLAFAAGVAPTLLLTAAGPVAAMDHHAYLPALAFLPAIAAALAALEKRFKAGAVLAGVLVVALGVLSMRQTSFWEDTETLWFRALAVSPKVYQARPNLAEYYAAQGRPGAALVMLAEHLKIFPDDVLMREEVLHFYDAYAPRPWDRPKLWAEAAREARVLGRDPSGWENLALKNGTLSP